MQAAGSVDHPLPPQSDTGGRGRSLVGGMEIQMGGVMSQWVGGVTVWGRIPHIYI